MLSNLEKKSGYKNLQKKQTFLVIYKIYILIILDNSVINVYKFYEKKNKIHLLTRIVVIHSDSVINLNYQIKCLSKLF